MIREILVLASRPGHPAGITIAVTDSGAGIAPAGMENMFKPLFTTKADRLGVGLSIPRSMIEGHGGRLWGTPNPERSATFHLALPAGAAA
jgi:C4-dicarboxylate-specific signal transduction histidine kinase